MLLKSLLTTVSKRPMMVARVVLAVLAVVLAAQRGRGWEVQFAGHLHAALSPPQVSMAITLVHLVSTHAAITSR
jgi:hypothetical protein